MSRFIPFPAYPDTAPIDLRFVYAAEAPAGKRGFLKAVGDHFEFEDKKTSALLKFNQKEERFKVEFDSFDAYMFVCAFENK